MTNEKFKIITNTVGVFHMYIYVPAGSVYETPKESGCSHMLEHMLFKNKGVVSSNLSKSMTEIGARYNAATYKDVTYYFIKTHSQHFKVAIGCLHQILTKGNFTEIDLDTERKVIIEEYNQTNDTFEYKFFQLANQSIMPKENVYTNSVIGNIKVLESTSAASLKEYFKKRYQNYTIVVNCEESIKGAVQRELVRLFGKNTELDMDDCGLVTLATKIEPKVIILDKTFKQYVTRITFQTFPGSDVKDVVLLQFMQYCLTGSGLFSLLNRELRVIRGLIYTVYSFAEFFRYTGTYFIQFGSSVKKTDYVVSLIFSLIGKLKKHGLPRNALDYYKQSYLNAQRLKFTDQDVRTEFYGVAAFYGSTITEDKVLSIIKKITNKDIIAISRKVMDYSRMGLISVGSYPNVDDMNNKIQAIINSYAALE